MINSATVTRAHAYRFVLTAPERCQTTRAPGVHNVVADALAHLRRTNVGNDEHFL